LSQFRVEGEALIRNRSNRSEAARRTCPICDEKQVEVWASLRQHTYIRCTRCQLVWLAEIPSEAELHAYYNSAYEVDRLSHSEKMRRQGPLLLSLIEKDLDERRNLLEVGCSYGYFLELARNRGWTVEGLEISREASTWARDRLQLSVRTGSLEEHGASWRACFDAVALFHVLEHHRHPRTLLEQTRDVLRMGGRILLRTPNAASWAARICRSQWEWLSPPAHIYLFTPASLKGLLQSVGFKIEAITTQRGDAHGLLFELVRASAKGLLSRGSSEAISGSQPFSHRGWFHTAQSLLEAAWSPLQPLENLALGPRFGQPELLVVAKKL
jgi:2-polyprenyl-3-methyl-5-hydroxy-6-metoxy-1,4-benzoquinol methylase